jgi:thymidylate synthase
MRSNEKQYIKLVKDIIVNGTLMQTRNDKCYNLFGASMKFDLTQGTIPFVTTKKLAWKTCLKELLWFIKGDTSNKNLREQNVRIWNGNSTREFLDSRELTSYPEDILGPVYGWQWRNFNGTYDVSTPQVDFSDPTRHDQLQQIITALKTNPEDVENPNKQEHKYSRRLVMSAWNPAQLEDMALPPCHVLSQFMVDDEDRLHMTLYQRSGDVGLGVPFNIASYSFLLCLVAHHCGLKPGTLHHTIGVAHIYKNHKDALMSQTLREIYDEPTIYIKTKRENIEDYIFDDFVVENYKYHPSIKMDMVA